MANPVAVHGGGACVLSAPMNVTKAMTNTSSSSTQVAVPAVSIMNNTSTTPVSNLMRGTTLHLQDMVGFSTFSHAYRVSW